VAAAAADHARQAGLAHQALDALALDADVVIETQLGVHPRRPIGPAALFAARPRARRRAGGIRQVQMTDALDAFVALYTALHVRAGDYEELGGEKDSTGLVMRMVFELPLVGVQGPLGRSQ
jgi:hypothetical protein